jgi:hypothetical protein
MSIWKAVEGFPGYEVSDTGKVRSTLWGSPRELSPVKRGKDNPRLYVNLRRDKKNHSQYVSKLVATAFVPNPEGHHIVDFKDGDLTNNSADNLMWVDRAHIMGRFRPKTNISGCSVEGCTNEAKTREMCSSHYMKWWTENRAGKVDSFFRKEIVGYAAAHHRVRSQRGLVSTQDCEFCGGQAEEYALKIDAEVLYREVGTRNNQAYSLNPADYMALCKGCHRSYDKENREALRARFNECIQVSRLTNSTTTKDKAAMVADALAGMTLHEVADKYGVNFSYVSRIAREELGMNLRDYRKANGLPAGAAN